MRVHSKLKWPYEFKLVYPAAQFFDFETYTVCPYIYIITFVWEIFHLEFQKRDKVILYIITHFRTTRPLNWVWVL